MTLTAGSYLKLLRDPRMDLLDVVEEEAPLFKNKVRATRHTLDVSYLVEHVEDGEVWDQETRSIGPFPHYISYDNIDYENTHGVRFGTCHQKSVTFGLEPARIIPFGHVPCEVRPYAENPGAGLNLHLTRILDENRNRGDDLHGFVFLPIDGTIFDEVYPGYPEEPQHLPCEEGTLDVDAELVRAFDTIRPAITADTSLLVTLAELRDVKSLFVQPMTFARELVRLTRRHGLGKKAFRDLFLDPDVLPFIARKVAEGHLYTEFGLKQVVRDTASLFGVFWSLDSMVRRILEATGENTRHYSLPLYKAEAEDVGAFYNNDLFSTKRAWQTSFTRKFVVTVKYTSELVDAYGQPISPNDPSLVKLGLAMDKLGLNLNPAILWDLVPFSFVVDYFVGIGDWLERFKLSNLNYTFGVLDSCYSIKEEWETTGMTFRYRVAPGEREASWDSPIQKKEDLIGTATFYLKSRKYDRVRFLPTLRMLTGVSAPEDAFREPNSGQLKIMASLLTTNLPRLW